MAVLKKVVGGCCIPTTIFGVLVSLEEHMARAPTPICWPRLGTEPPARARARPAQRNPRRNPAKKEKAAARALRPSTNPGLAGISYLSPSPLEPPPDPQDGAGLGAAGAGAAQLGAAGAGAGAGLGAGGAA